MLRSASYSQMKIFECAPGTAFDLGKIQNNSKLYGSKNMRSPLSTQ